MFTVLFFSYNLYILTKKLIYQLVALVKARQRRTSHLFSTLTKLYSHVILICTWKNKLWTLLTHQHSPERLTGNIPAKGLETPFLPEASFQIQPCTMLATSEDVFIKLWKPMLRLKPEFVPLCSLVFFSDGERMPAFHCFIAINFPPLSPRLHTSVSLHPMR